MRFLIKIFLLMCSTYHNIYCVNKQIWNLLLYALFCEYQTVTDATDFWWKLLLIIAFRFKGGNLDANDI